MAETDIPALVESMRDDVKAAINRCTVRGISESGVCVTLMAKDVLAIIADWEQRGKERDEAIRARNSELMKLSFWETFEAQSAALADSINEREALSARVAELERALRRTEWLDKGPDKGSAQWQIDCAVAIGCAKRTNECDGD